MLHASKFDIIINRTGGSRQKKKKKSSIKFEKKMPCLQYINVFIRDVQTTRWNNMWSLFVYSLKVNYFFFIISFHYTATICFTWIVSRTRIRQLLVPSLNASYGFQSTTQYIMYFFVPLRSKLLTQREFPLKHKRAAALLDHSIHLDQILVLVTKSAKGKRKNNKKLRAVAFVCKTLELLL